MPMETNRMLPENIIGEVQTCHDLVQCAFSLAGFEVEVYYQLSQSGPLRADELAVKIGKDSWTAEFALPLPGLGSVLDAIVRVLVNDHLGERFQGLAH